MGRGFVCKLEFIGEKRNLKWPPLTRGLSAKLTGGEIEKVSYHRNFGISNILFGGSLPPSRLRRATSLVRGRLFSMPFKLPDKLQFAVLPQYPTARPNSSSRLVRIRFRPWNFQENRTQSP